MRFAKRLGLLALVIGGLMVFAATASATRGTDSSGGSEVEWGDPFHATNVGNTVLDGTINITCNNSTLGGKVTQSGGSFTLTILGIESLTFGNCGNNTVTVLKKGYFTVHTDTANANGNGTFTSSETEITVLTHNILGTVHCIYETYTTDFGTLDGSNNTGGTATLTIDSVPIPQKAPTDFGCGSTSELTAEYTVSTPDYLAID